MKVLALTLGILTATINGPSPRVLAQMQAPDGSRLIRVHNPRSRAVWVHFECEKEISNLIRLPERKTVIVKLEGKEPVSPKPCYLLDWAE